MKLAIYTEPLPPQFHWNPLAPWRGTEEFYVETAKHLAAAGHVVEVFYDGAAIDEPDAVRYLPRAEYRAGHDAVLSCNVAPPAVLPSTRHVYWTNLWKDRFERHLWADEQVVISDFHRQSYEDPIDSLEGSRYRTHVVGHGVDAARYAGGTKEPIALYSSSMDRGGYWLVDNWHRFGTGLELVCTAGEKTDAEMVDLYKRAKVWLHPGLGVELFCIAALKAQAAGCLCVYSPTMALPETIRPGHLALPLLRWRSDLVDLNKTPAPAVPVDLPSWGEVTSKLERILCPSP
jgi:hypothetical protein